MKKLLLLLFFLLPIVTRPHLARAVALDCATYPSDYACTCFGDVGAAFEATGSYDDDLAATADECFANCAAGGATSYQFDACASDGSVTSSGQQSLVSSTTTSTAATSATTTAKPNALIPNLNIAIPGLDLAGSVVVDSETGIVQSNLLGLYVAAIYRYLIVATALIAVVFLMIGGLGYATARGNAKAVDKAKSRITNAIIGLILVLASYDIAFLIDPNTTQFKTLNFQKVEGIALESEGLEQEDLSGALPGGTALTGNLTRISGTHLINSTNSSSDYIDADVLSALNTAADAYFTATGKNIVVTSASRTVLHQAEIFFDKCLPGGYCKPATCDVTGRSGSVLSYSNGKYTLTGALAGQTSRSTVTAGLAASGNASNCPHTSNVAIDIWPVGSSNYRANVKDVQNLMSIMTQNGFCRLSSEAWHYELDSVKVDTSSCSTSYASTNIKGHSTAGCTKYDFKNFCCVQADSTSSATNMCTS